MNRPPGPPRSRNPPTGGRFPSQINFQQLPMQPHQPPQTPYTKAKFVYYPAERFLPPVGLYFQVMDPAIQSQLPHRIEQRITSRLPGFLRLLWRQSSSWRVYATQAWIESNFGILKKTPAPDYMQIRPTDKDEKRLQQEGYIVAGATYNLQALPEFTAKAWALRGRLASDSVRATMLAQRSDMRSTHRKEPPKQRLGPRGRGQQSNPQPSFEQSPQPMPVSAQPSPYHRPQYSGGRRGLPSQVSPGQNPQSPWVQHYGRQNYQTGPPPMPRSSVGLQPLTNPMHRAGTDTQVGLHPDTRNAFAGLQNPQMSSSPRFHGGSTNSSSGRGQRGFAGRGGQAGQHPSISSTHSQQGPSPVFPQVSGISTNYRHGQPNSQLNRPALVPTISGFHLSEQSLRVGGDTRGNTRKRVPVDQLAEHVKRSRHAAPTLEENISGSIGQEMNAPDSEDNVIRSTNTSNDVDALDNTSR
ncbi:hypothetical protein CC80DRAFT_553475 [Byssothecium circinans]|uniref:Uncharacterized protein n=1 Tax=Byssothecium circinans TaxID=147558 RepID=A0A6A5TG85_9PLEO|nr:hypothetical protein CC80DRAFT_553475 [Byssothecium circinans]